MRMICLSFALMLGGCAAVIPDPPAAPKITCPPIATYSALEQSVLSDELAKDGPETVSQIEDYIKLRQACRG
jgi:hypothetical protein